MDSGQVYQSVTLSIKILINKHMKIKNLVLIMMAVISMFLQPVLIGQKKEAPTAAAQKIIPTIVPVIVNGEVQKIPAFDNPDEWIRHDLWVETEFDTDGDGKKDRMHVDVTQAKTDRNGRPETPCDL